MIDTALLKTEERSSRSQARNSMGADVLERQSNQVQSPLDAGTRSAGDILPAIRSYLDHVYMTLSLPLIIPDI